MLTKWNEEAQAALGSIDAGVIPIRKDSADAVGYVIAIFEWQNAVAVHGTALATFGTLPMFQRGHIIIDEAESLVDYMEWADYLAKSNS